MIVKNSMIKRYLNGSAVGHTGEEVIGISIIPHTPCPCSMIGSIVEN